ncbi:hypothetical protein ACLOJK_008574 [Asimina triloba]
MMMVGTVAGGGRVVMMSTLAGRRDEPPRQRLQLQEKKLEEMMSTSAGRILLIREKKQDETIWEKEKKQEETICGLQSKGPSHVSPILFSCPLRREVSDRTGQPFPSLARSIDSCPNADANVRANSSLLYKCPCEIHYMLCMVEIKWAGIQQ